MQKTLFNFIKEGFNLAINNPFINFLNFQLPNSTHFLILKVPYLHNQF